MSDVQYSKQGRSLSDADLDGVEKELGIKLPVEYREFLLAQNGGVPKPRRYATASSEDGRVEHFYSVAAKDRWNDLAGLTGHFRSELELPKKYLPVALLDCDDILLLQVTRPHSVFHWRGIEEGFDKEDLEKVASGFPEFLKMLTNKPQTSATSNRKVLYERAVGAIHGEKPGKLRQLIKAGLDVNYVPKGEWALLIQAAISSDIEAIKVLVERGADIDVVDHNENTARDLAERNLRIATQTLAIIQKGRSVYTAKEFQHYVQRYEQEVKQAQEIVDLLSSRTA